MSEIKEKYPITPMHKHFKEVVWYQLAREPPTGGRDDNSGVLHRMKWLFKAEDFPCGACSSSNKIKFMVLPTGVYRTCEEEGFTEKTDPVSIGPTLMEAVLLEDLICTNQQAIDVVKMYHQERIYVGDRENPPIFFPRYTVPTHAGKVKCKLSVKAEIE
jgi:hypothetical protein